MTHMKNEETFGWQQNEADVPGGMVALEQVTSVMLLKFLCVV